MRALFSEVTCRGVVAPGACERKVGDRIGDLACAVLGSAACRPRRTVRSGPNSVLPYGQEPSAGRAIGTDDVVVVELGPVLAGYEACFARTVVLGDDPETHRLLEDLPEVFAAAREAFRKDRGITGRRLHAEVPALAAKAGWALGGWHVGHFVGTPAVANSLDARPDAYLGPDDSQPLRRTTEDGWQAHWVLEIHLVDENRFTGSYKDLLVLA
ncbi:peptidase M24 [Actinobacteria bacterium OV450]|nr:peptidase M24 [Actinobacteria bacterium OV450]